VLSNGIKSTLSLVIPSAVLYLILAQPISYLLLFKNHLNNRGIYLTSESLKMLALGLPGFCLYMLVVRGFQTMRNARIVFVLYLIENSLNIVLAFLLAPKMGIKGICLSISIAYTVGFVIGALILRIKSGSFKKQKPIAHAIKILLSSVLAGLFASFGSALFGSTGALYNLLNLILGLGLGIVGFFLGALILSGWRT
jgi:putative peptidoglycan lipid II flippase